MYGQNKKRSPSPEPPGLSRYREQQDWAHGERTGFPVGHPARIAAVRNLQMTRNLNGPPVSQFRSIHHYLPPPINIAAQQPRTPNVPDNDDSSSMATTATEISPVEFETLVSQALFDGTTAAYARSKLMVVGEGRSGKTSTIRSLLNKMFWKSQPSTTGFEVKKVDVSDWEEDAESNFFIEHLENCVKSRPRRNLDTRDKSDVVVEIDEIKRYGEDLMLSSRSKQETPEKEPLSFSIWDFGGQKVFYSLHHLFLTEYGLYLLVFDATSLVDDKRREASIEYLRFWLFSKKIHAPAARILLVGTHADELSNKEINSVQKVLSERVLKNDSFFEVSMGNLSFIPIDNKFGTGIEDLRNLIEKTVRSCDYIKDEVPIHFLRLLELVSQNNEDFLTLRDAKEAMTKCGLDESCFTKALEFLNARGLVTYFSKHETLRRFVVLNPQWLINGFTTIFYDEEEHETPYYEPEFARDFRKFMKEKVISEKLLNHLWEKKNMNEEIREFMKTVLLEASLMCNYTFEVEKSFLIPALFSPTAQLLKDETSISSTDDYSGPFFVLDFSGNYDAEIVKDDGKSFVRYLPFGTFERLVCLCVAHSAACEESMKPEINTGFCRLSFGVDVDFEISATLNENGEKLWIKVTTEEETSFEAARDLVVTIYSMVDSVRKDFFSKSGTDSSLAISLLLPSSKDTGNVLAEYNLLQNSMKKSIKKIRPSKLSRKKVPLNAYQHWFPENSQGNRNLLNPQQSFDEVVKKDPCLKDHKFAGPYKALPGELKYHCFLSYKQSSAIDLVGKQYYVLEKRGFRCWYDQKFNADINLENMQQGVRQSMVYILFLSKDIFPSFFVEQEIKMALELDKPIIFLHHPDTGSSGYSSFSDYIQSAPDIVKPLFSNIESIQLQRRHHLEEAVTMQLTSRLQNIIEDFEDEC